MDAGRFRRAESSRGVAEQLHEDFGIRAFDGREEFEELMERVAVRKIVDESLHRNPRAAKDHGTAQHSGVG